MNEFEIAADAVEPSRDLALENENVIEFLRGAKMATVSFTQGRYMKRIRKLAEQFPDRVKITYETDDVVVAHVPVSAIKINLTTPREMTDEQREQAKVRLEAARAKRGNKNG